MSLTCDLYINGELLGELVAHRVEGVGLEADDVNTYLTSVRTADRHWSGHVQHRYGDGAWGLVRRVLEAAGEMS